MEVELIGEAPRWVKTNTVRRCTVPLVVLLIVIVIVIAVCVVLSVLYTSKKEKSEKTSRNATNVDHDKTTVNPPINDTVCLSSACLQESAGE